MSISDDYNNIDILYVEDDKDTREITHTILSDFFQNIVVAIDGEDGLNKFKEKYKKENKPFDLVITDINMPKLSGIDMLEQIKQIHTNIYSIVITANLDHTNFIKTVQLGIRGYIVKPVCLEQLTDVLDEAVKNINAAKNINILKQYKDIVDQSSIVSKTDLKGRITFANEKFCKISGYSQEELLGKNHNLIRDKDMPQSVFKELWDTITQQKIWTGQVKNRKKDGGSYYVDATICPILDENGNTLEYIALRNDITDIINPKKQLLDNIKTLQRPMLILMQIDNYKTLEYLYDEQVLENMLKVFEQKIVTYLPSGFYFHKIINLGDGEFAILQEMKENDTSATQKEIQIKQLQQNINEAVIQFDKYNFYISVIISFSTIKTNIYENVKSGLNKAIETNTDIIFSNNLIEKERKIALANSKIIQTVKTALESHKMVSYFQPIINNDTMQIEKYESLVRLIDENNNIISPFAFLDVSKKSRYYNIITTTILHNSFEALNNTDKEISMNLSAIDIENDHTRNHIINLITQNIHNANRMVFELLEDEKVNNFEIVKDFIALIKTFGCQIAIDDFGAGVSNYERLLDYQPDILKIDACLIKHIDTDKYSRDVVETIQLFASKQKIKTVAEFVSTPEILKIIKEIGINYSQGFLLGKPEPIFLDKI